mgnify:CR=1 FL=1
MKKKILLLARAFEEVSAEEFFGHAKKLMKPAKPKVVKTRKKKTSDDDNTGLKPVAKTNRKTKKDAGLIETT